MAVYNTPNQFTGNEKIKSAEMNENFSAAVDGTSDGTKDLLMNTVAVGTDLNVTYGQVDNDCTTLGEPNGERVYFQLVGGFTATKPSGSTGKICTFLNTFATTTEVPGMVMPRSGVVVSYGLYATGNNPISPYREFGFEILANGTAIMTTATHVNNVSGVYTYAVYNAASQVSFAAGDVLSARHVLYSYTCGIIEPQLSHVLNVEVQFT